MVLLSLLSSLCLCVSVVQTPQTTQVRQRLFATHGPAPRGSFLWPARFAQIPLVRHDRSARARLLVKPCGKCRPFPVVPAIRCLATLRRSVVRQRFCEASLNLSPRRNASCP